MDCDFLLQRVQEYKTDFACYSYSCFNAFRRLNEGESRRHKRRSIMNLISLLLSIFSISAFMTLVFDFFAKEVSLFIATILGIISIFLNLKDLIEKRKDISYEYFLRAERVNVLWKKTRDVEAMIKAGYMSEKDILDKITYFQTEAEKYALEPLYISREDYELAKEQLAQGQKSYNEEELTK